MIKLTFAFQREILRFKVSNRDIFYTDRKWGDWLRCIPKDDNFIKKIIMSRNKIPRELINIFNLSPEEQKEYDEAKTEEELANNIIKDCKSKSLILVSKEIE